jgi:predicted RNase H-like HicB family nuclease
MTDLAYPMVVYAVAEEEGGGFVAFAPDLLGCVGDGDTAELAIADLRSAILEWIDEAVSQKRDVPAPGAAAAKLNEERKEIKDILDNQVEIIKAQDALIASYRAQIDRLREVSVLLESRQRVSKPYALFEYGQVVEVAGSPSGRRKKVFSVSH